MKVASLFLWFGLCAAGVSACGGGDTGTGGTAGTGGSAGTGGTGGSGGMAGAGGTGGSTSTGGTGTGGSMPLCTMPAKIACSDQIILDMNLQKTPTKGAISSAADGAGWKSNVDATAGGAFAATPESYTYGKFTDQGLTKVDIADVDSLASMDWDIAFRRYVVRINSGDSGPSCVQAAPIPGKNGMPAKYEDVASVPDKPAYHTDDYFTDSCDFIPDGSGLMNSPATALSGYWSYPGCVKMTGQVYVIELASGKHVKLIVDDYYKPDVQTQCNTTSMVPMANTGSANFIVRWAFLD